MPLLCDGDQRDVAARVGSDTADEMHAAKLREPDNARSSHAPRQGQGTSMPETKAPQLPLQAVLHEPSTLRLITMYLKINAANFLLLFIPYTSAYALRQPDI